MASGSNRHTGQTFENLNPADTRDVVGVFQKSGKADVTSRRRRQTRLRKWRLVPAPRRAEMIFTAPREILTSARKSTRAT